MTVQRVGAYEVLYELRSGGMGSVLLARRRGPGSFEKLVAIKTIRADLAAAKQVRAMFLDEAAILARLGHPAVATVHDFGEEGGNLYLVMEYVAGVALHAVTDRRPPAPITARIIAEAARGIHAAHELRDLQGALLGVVHRDISPDNVLLGFDGRVKVIDFGIALIKGRQAPVTEMGMLKGKPPYMSPEQIKNEAIDRRSDVFALGAVLWEMLVGEPLFQGDSIYAIARAIEHQRLEPPSARAPGLPPRLDALVLAALERDAKNRLPTAAALAQELDAVVAAAGGESLEAWAHRELAAPREQHQRWLAKVLGGGSAPAPIGRATGAVTAMAQQAPAAPEFGPAQVQVSPQLAPTLLPAAPAHGDRPPTLAAPRAGSSAEGPAAAPAPVAQHGQAGQPGQIAQPGPVAQPGQLGPVAQPWQLGSPAARQVAAGASRHHVTSALTLRRPSRYRFALVLAILALGAGVMSWAILSWPRGQGGARADAGDAPAPLLVVASTDAASPAVDAGAPPPRDAQVALGSPDAAPDEPDDPSGARPDARSRRPPGGRDAGSRERPDARRAERPDARVEPRPDPRPDPTPDPTFDPAGPPGKLRITAEPYANVIIDGRQLGPTPILGRVLPAGRHEVTLVDPVTGAIRLRRTVDVGAGQVVSVSVP